MRARIWMIVVVNFALMFFSEPARALGVECPDATIPGVYSVSERYENMDFGVILYPESATVVLCGGIQLNICERPTSWDYFYGDYFIFEKPDLCDVEEDSYKMRNLLEEEPVDEGEKIEILPPQRRYRQDLGVMVADFDFWSF